MARRRPTIEESGGLVTKAIQWIVVDRIERLAATRFSPRRARCGQSGAMYYRFAMRIHGSGQPKPYHAATRVVKSALSLVPNENTVHIIEAVGAAHNQS